MRAGSLQTMREQMHQLVRHLRREQPYSGEDETDHPDAGGAIGERNHAGDDCGRRQHNPDLIRRRSELIIVVARHGGIALVLVLLGLRFELLAPILLLGVGVVTLHGRIPGFDLLAHRRLVGVIAAVRSVVWRTVFAWKKFQVSEALILSSSPAVCALLPSVSERARNSARTAISSAIFRFRLGAEFVP